MSDHILEMRSISKTFPGVKALDDVSLNVRRGEIHAICGENGAGKSTLMQVLSGVHPAGTYEGEIYLDGEPVSFHSINESEAHGIVIIHQELALIPELSVAENIFLGNERARGSMVNWHQTNAGAAELMARVGMHEEPTALVSWLGVGKQQLLEIAKALSKDVRLLILDEPTAALNEQDSQHLLGLLRELQEHGITCIMISHKLNEIADIAESTTVIRDGHTVETIDMSSPEASQERIIRGMVGRDLGERFPERDVEPGDEVFRISGWTVMHPTQAGRTVVEDAELYVRAGEVVGLAGLMGAGRTELAMSVFGRSYGRTVAGSVLMHGREVRTNSVSEAIENAIAYVTEDRKRYGLNLIDDVRRNISAAGLRQLANRGWVHGNEEIVVAERYRDELGIKTPSVFSVTQQLSGGNQQKVVLGKWLYTEPEVLILDEPTRGIDVGAKQEIYVIINDLVRSGKSVLLISSELPELLGMCDRIYTLSAGRITGDVARSDASQERLMELMTQDKDLVR
jgi:putative multiple sugar transport system ATP-binding protein